MATNYGQGRPTHPDAMQARCEAARALVAGGPAAVRPIRKFPRPDEHAQVLRPFPSEGTPVWHGVKNLRAAIPIPPAAKGIFRRNDASSRARDVRRAKGQEGY